MWALSIMKPLNSPQLTGQACEMTTIDPCHEASTFRHVSDICLTRNLAARPNECILRLRREV